MEFLIAIIVIGLVLYLIRNASLFASSTQFPVESKPILTRHESVFAEKLTDAVGDCDIHIFPQVSMQAFMKVRPGTSRDHSIKIRNKFAQKHVDFLLADASMQPILIVELDDRTHRKVRDQARDALTAAAGIKTVRLRNGYRITPAEIRAEIVPHLPLSGS